MAARLGLRHNTQTPSTMHMRSLLLSMFTTVALTPVERVGSGIRWDRRSRMDTRCPCARQNCTETRLAATRGGNPWRSFGVGLRDTAAPGPVRPDLSSTAISRTCMTPARPCAAMLAIVGAAQGQPHGRFCASCAKKLRPHARNPMLYPLGPHTRAMETPRTTRRRCLAFSRTRQSFRNAWTCRPATMAEEAIWIHGRGPLWPT